MIEEPSRDPTTAPRRPRFTAKGAIAVVAALAAVGWAFIAIRDSSEAHLWARKLKNGEADDRQIAARELRYHAKTPEDLDVSVAALVRSLDDPAPEVRSEVIGALGEIVLTAMRSEAGPPPARSAKSLRDATNSLIAAARDGDPNVRALVVALLGAIGPEGPADPAPTVVAALRDESPLVRTAALKSAGSLGPKADPAIPILLKTASGEDRQARAVAARSLEAVKPSPAVVPLLVESLRSPDRETRIRAATVLGHIGPGAAGASPDLIARLKEEFKTPLPQPVPRGPSASYDPGSAVARALAQVAPETGASPETLAALTDALQTPEDPRHSAIASAFGLLGPRAVPAVPALIADLKRATSKDAYAGQVARALSQIAPGTPAEGEVIAALAEALKSESDSTRMGAAWGLGEFGVKAAPALDALRAVMEKDKSPRVRAQAEESAEMIKPTEVAESK
jgi:HEAT repeat protein